MRIAVVSAFYSEGMGYTENCLPKALASLGHEVHVVASDLNVYANTADYERTYSSFLGPGRQRAGSFAVDGYTVHRRPSRMLSGYVYFSGLADTIRQIAPDVAHSLEVASLQTFQLALIRPLCGFRLFTETHQHMSVVKPFLKTDGGHLLRRAAYRLTRTAPTALASAAIERCYAISPDCADVANRFYGVPPRKLKLQSLGSDTDLFRPAETGEEVAARRQLRASLGYGDDDIVCVYTGRFSGDKNPLLLARAVDALALSRPRFKALFIGDGVQRKAIEERRNAAILPFMTHRRLSEVYRAADVAVWPMQESMSMLDAASSGLPLVVSNRMGERERVDGNGAVFEEASLEDLTRVLARLESASLRREYGMAGRAKMLRQFSWRSVAKSVEADYLAACGS